VRKKLDWSDVIAIISLVVSTTVAVVFGYFQFFYENRQLLFRPVHALERKSDRGSLEVLAINSGNRSLIVTGMNLVYWDEQPTQGAHTQWKSFAPAAPFEPVLLEPGSIRTVRQEYAITEELLFNLGKPRNPEGPSERELILGISYEVLDDTGSMWNSYRYLGSVHSKEDRTSATGFSAFTFTDASKPYEGLTNKIEGKDFDFIREPRDPRPWWRFWKR
jgi:hypothetical protein